MKDGAERERKQKALGRDAAILQHNDDDQI